MTKLMSRFGDKALSLFLRKEEAGACTECPGVCGYYYENNCSGGTLFRWRCKQYYTCDCGCKIQSGSCVLISTGSC